MRYVYNKYHKDAPADAVYVGRGSPYGNPYSHLDNTKAEHRVWSRQEAIAAFEQNVLPTLDVTALKGKALVCFCYPKSCHADSLARKANNLS